MKVELSYRATDYQPISEIKLVNNTYEALFEKIPELIVIVLCDFLDKCEKRLKRKYDDMSDNSIFIGRGEERSKEKISLYANFEAREDSKVTRKCLNGIVGALAGKVTYKKDRLLAKLQTQLDTVSEDFESLVQEDIEFSINLQIISRFDSEQHAYFVASLLLYGNVDVNNYSVYESQDEIFDFLLIDLLKKNLLEAIPKGYYRKYHRFEENDTRIRGTVDIARHIRLNMGQNNGRIAYGYRENSIINSFNELIVAAYDCLKSKYPEIVDSKIDSDIVLNDYISELKRNITSSSSLAKLIGCNNIPIAHPYFQEYETVRQICLRILRDESVSIFDAADGEVSGFLYYLPDLWEEFLGKIIKDGLDGLKQKVRCELVTQPPEHYLESNNGSFNAESRPDFAFTIDDKYFLVLDAKMKPKWKRAILPGEAGRSSSLSALVGEDINKCLRDMLVFSTEGTGVIFPISAKDKKKAEETGRIKYKRRLTKNNAKQLFYVFPFCVPDCNENIEYTKWRQYFDSSISDFKDVFYREAIDEYQINNDRMQIMHQLMEKLENNSDILLDVNEYVDKILKKGSVTFNC